MADLVYDSFNRSDGGVGTSDSGHTWTKVGTHVLSVSSNRAATTTTGYPGYTYLDAGEAPSSISAQVLAHGSSGLSAGIIFRGVSDTKYRTAFLYYTGSGTSYRVYLYVYDGGWGASTYASVTATNGNYYPLEILDDGSTIEVWFNGSKVLESTSDTTFNTGTRVGLSANWTTARFDDFLAANSEPTALVVADASHAHSAGAPALAQAHTLAVAGTAHAHSAAAPVLTQAHVLAVDGATHGHAADSAIVTVDPTLGAVTLVDAAVYAAGLADASAYGLALTDASRYRLTLADALVYAATATDAAVTALTLEESLG